MDSHRRTKDGPIEYFYADANNAATYDELVGLTDPGYRPCHEVMRYIFDKWIDGLPHGEISVLDIGCGTGAEAMPALIRHPNIRVHGLDISTAMLDIFEKKASRAGESVRTRLTTYCMDFRTDAWNIDIASTRAEPFDCVITAFALHHLDFEEKSRVISKARSLLKPGGLFLYADLFDFENKWLSALGQEFLEAQVVHQLTDSCSSGYASIDMSEVERSRLAEMWVKHCRYENAPLPMHAAFDRKQIGNKMDECSLLMDKGFESVECTYRCMQTGMIVAEASRG